MDGKVLNAQVWRLFENAGFQTIPNSLDTKTEHTIIVGGKPRTPDLFAVEKTLKVKILAENKSGKKIGGSTTSVINDLAALVTVEKANAGILIMTEKEVTEKEINYGQKKKVFIWTDEQFRYYQILVDTLGEYSKFEIIASLNIKTYEQSFLFSTVAIQIQQPYANSRVNLYLFTISPEILLKTCVILRRAQGNKDAYQRLLSKKRLGNIQKFVSTKDALLPTNLILHFNEEIIINEIRLPRKNKQKQRIQLPTTKVQLVNLQIPLKYGSLEILDGQHRLYGFLHSDAATKDMFNLVVCGIENLDSKARRDTFIAINDNAKKIDPNLVSFLKFVEDENECQNNEELMAIKVVYLLSKRNGSPFFKKIRILDLHTTQVITLKGFAGYDLKTLLGKNGILRKYYPHTSGEYIKLLTDYFNAIKFYFGYQYNDPHKYIFFTNRGISAFLKLLKSILKFEDRSLNEKDFKVYAKIISDNSTKNDWEIIKLRNKYVGSGGWKELHRDLVKKVKTQLPGFMQ